MAFPVVAATNSGNQATDTTSHTINLPTGITAGDLLMLFLAFDGDPGVSGTPTGWVRIAWDHGTSPSARVYYKIADGTEGSTYTLTSDASEQSAHITYRITGWHGTTPPEISTVATGTSSSPNGGLLDPTAWGVEDTLWIATWAWDDGTTSTSFYPTDYPNNRVSNRANSSTGAGIGTATRNEAVQTGNPQAASLSASEAWKAYTIAVRPGTSGGGGGGGGGGSTTDLVGQVAI